MKDSVTLKEIASWQESQQVALPTVQRGFVWKPYQIENLWDSLLRGYPIGSFVLTKPLENKTMYEILDGQQRATSIILGFENKTFRGTENKMKVFVDIDNSGLPENDSRKFLIRVITKSHPWGYSQRDNNKTLSTNIIKQALNDVFEIDNYLDKCLDTFFPIDSRIPIPLHFFLDSSSAEEVSQKIKSWKLWEKVRKRIELKDEDKILELVSDMFSVVSKMLKNQRIPLLTLDFDTLNENKKVKSNNDDNVDEIENLFVRLNSGGTPLSGEELNYSILKAHLDLKTQELIESSCGNFIKPSRFISIAYRLFQHSRNDTNKQDAISLRVKPKQFQKDIKSNHDKFEEFLNQILKDENYDGNTLLTYIVNLLKYEKNKNKEGLPFLIIQKISESAPEVMFILMYRVFVAKDEIHKDRTLWTKVIGITTLFLWFGKGEKSRDHKKLLTNIWPLSKSTSNHFWSNSLIQRAQLEGQLISIPKLESTEGEIGLSYIRDIAKYQYKQDIVEMFNKATEFAFKTYISKALYEIDLILYAQREFLDDIFKDEHFVLEDTNTPFDWDHISPNNFYHNKRTHIPHILRSWYNSNGNFRAWPYSLNRADSNDIPSVKFAPEPNDKLISDLKKLNPKVDYSKKGVLSKHLLKWSFCNEEWVSCEVRDLSYNNNQWREVLDLIRTRAFNIVAEWYNTLKIESLYNEISQAFIEDFINKSKMRNLNIEERFKIFGDEIIDDGRLLFVSNTLTKSKLRFYLIFDDLEEKRLNENNFEFGVFEDSNKAYIISDINKVLKDNDNYEFSMPDNAEQAWGKQWIYSSFSLTANSNDSIAELLTDFYNWLKNIPEKFGETLLEDFKFILSLKGQKALINIK